MKVTAIIAAAGLGKRMGGDRPKQYLELGGRPIICHTLDRFLNASVASDVIVVVEPGREADFKKDILEAYGYPKSWMVICGGAARQDSIANGLRHVSADCDVILVHDGVRPFVTTAQIERAAAVAMQDGACVIASPIKETVKRVGPEGIVIETVDRKYLWSAETPQGFLTNILKEAMTAASNDGFVGTDDASLVERLGIQVTVIEGTGHNIKITTPADIAIAEAILKEWK